jgi:hypothetical protein
MNAANFVTRRRLSRRTLLRGAGAALALPLLDAMTPALARAGEAPASSPPRRFVAVCATLGFHRPFLFPEETGRDYRPTPYLEPLKDLRDRLTVISGLSHAEQGGSTGHSSEMTWLTAARRPGLAGFRNSVSLDQFIAERIGPKTRFPSLVLSLGPESLSWTANGVPIPAEHSPARLFKQLFVDGGPAESAAQERSLRRGRGVLDAVRDEARRLERDLGPRDRERLDEYLTAVGGLETRLRESQEWVARPKPKVTEKPPTDIANRNDAIGRARLMYDMIALALQTDSARTVTLRLSGLNAVPAVEGVANDWHNLSHHGQDPAKIEELKRIELAEFRALADFLGRLAAAKEGGGTLLDSTAVLFGSNLGNASSHDLRNLPIVLAGGGFRHAGHLAAGRPGEDAPLSNLFVSLARHMGIEADRFGGSTAAGLPGLETVGG